MKLYIAGHTGMVGSAVTRTVEEQRGSAAEIITRTHDELDLIDRGAVEAFLKDVRPDAVIMAAARVGGILANDRCPADFIHDNLAMELNVIHGAFAAGIERLLFMGSSCVYPRLAEQPMREEALLTGPLEPTNEPYAVAKIAGIKLCESYNRQHGTDYRSIMPTNLYGPGDNFHPEHSHVLPALIRRFDEAVEKGFDEVVIWGSGKPKREFLHVEDLADAALFVLELERNRYSTVTESMRSHLNVGTGTDISIAALAGRIARITGFEGTILYDRSKPDGTPRKLLDVSRIKDLGWTARIPLVDGLRMTYDWYRENRNEIRG